MVPVENPARIKKLGAFHLLPVLLLATFIILLPQAFAQQLTGTLTGTVFDASGGVVPGAQVSLVNAASGDTRTAVSDEGGRFVITAVQPATYSLKVESKNYTPWQEDGIVMNTGDHRDIPNIKLTVGSVSNTVKVVGGGSDIVPTDTAEISTTLNEKMIDSFPLTGRNAGELLQVMPGMALNNNTGSASKSFGNLDTEIGSNTGPVGDYSSNGTQPNGTMAYMLDGADLVDPGNFGTQIANINPDMVGTIKFLSADYTAEYAKGPSIFEAFSRSGGKDFHGEGYYYTHNSALDSVDAFTKSQGGTNASESFNYIGGNVGGPVRLPFLKFNRNRDKLFFWGGFEYMIQHPAGSIINYNVPTPAQLSGDFSNAGVPATAITTWPKFYNQLTQNVPAGGSATSIPITDEDPNMPGILKLYPAPNETPSANNGWYNYRYVNTSPQNRWEASGKLDYSISDNTKLSGSYTYQHENDLAPISIWWALPNTLPYPSPGASATETYVINTNLTHVFNPTTTNETVFSWSHFVNPYKLANLNAVTRSTNNFSATGLFSNTTPQIPNFEPDYCCSEQLASVNYYPMTSPTGPLGAGSFGGVKQVPAFYDNFTKVFGPHTIKVGFYWDHSSNQQNSNGPDNGTYNFQNYGQNSTTNLVADMMLGYVNSYQQQNKDVAQDNGYHQVSVYAQDSWRANPRLTVNFGLRFDHVGQWYGFNDFAAGNEVWDYANYDNGPNAPNNTGLEWNAIDKSIPLSGFVTRPIYYAPRGGIAWDIFGTGKTVFRGGMGVFRYQVTSETAEAGNGPAGSFEYTSPTVFNGIASSSTLTPPSSVAQNGSSVYAMQRGDSREPFTNDWSVSVTQALAWHSVLDVSYVGNRSANEYMDGTNSNLFNLNNIPIGGIFGMDPVTHTYVSPAPPPCSTTNSADESLYCQANPTTYSQTYNVNDFRPLANYQNVYLVTHAPYSNYNALQVSFTKQSGPVTFLTNYTFSKVLGTRDGGSNNGSGNGAGLDPFNLRNDYGPLEYDHTQIMNLVYNWTLPRAIRSSTFGNRILGGAVNSWQLSGYTSFQSGYNLQLLTGGDFNVQYPTGLTVPTVANPTLPDNSITMPNGLKAIGLSPSTYFGTSAYNVLMPALTCNPTANLHGSQRFNPNCFTAPAYGTQGSYNMPYMRAPNYWNNNLGIYKDFHFNDTRYLQFRISATNWVNHPLRQFGLANSSDEELSFIGTANATCAGCVTSSGAPLQVQYLSPTNTNTTTTGTPAFKTGQRIVTVATKFYF
jgi:hypothetical protein